MNSEEFKRYIYPLTLSDLSKMIGVSRRTVENWSCGRRSIPNWFIANVTQDRINDYFINLSDEHYSKKRFFREVKGMAPSNYNKPIKILIALRRAEK